MPGHIALITEDSPTEVLATRILAHVDPEATFSPRLGRKGLGHVVSRLRGLNQAASGMKIVAIADRDTIQNCPIDLVHRWLGGPPHPNLVVRFAEMEAESWIMADCERLADFLDVQQNRIPTSPDTVAHPKEMLVNIARLSRNRRIREDMCPPKGATSLVGPNYNSSLELFLRTRWRISSAIKASPSLCRAESRIRELAFR
ncbi:hypothetical protein [Rhodoplanes sp. SY1]|uniref:hypothetical protein n=1 Tax=Rhodoplanes sp. SY1 TaxID=3166646 RepID=UPI0038B69381